VIVILQGVQPAGWSPSWTSAFLCAESGIAAASLNDQAAYIAGWLGALKNDSRLIVIAAAQLEKAADFILHRSP
jgi:antirestriction protein ArdC